MQTQDVKYIAMKKTIEANKIRKMQSELHMIDEANNIKNTHIFFTDSGDEDMDLDMAKRLNTHPSLLHRRTNRPRLEDLDKIIISDTDIEVYRKRRIEFSYLNIFRFGFHICFFFLRLDDEEIV